MSERQNQQTKSPPFSQQKTTPKTPPPRNTEPRPDALEEARKIAEQTAQRHPEYRWLTGDAEGIIRVINTVRILREKDSSITDKEVYLRYRRALERAEPEPRIQISFNIIAALMGGKPNGKLPF